MDAEGKISVNYNAIDELMMEILMLHRKAQVILDETADLLRQTANICENIPYVVRESELIARTQEINNETLNYDFADEGQNIVCLMQGLIDALYEVEQIYSNQIRECGTFFQKDENKDKDKLEYNGSGFVAVTTLDEVTIRNELMNLDVVHEYMKEYIFPEPGIIAYADYLSDYEVEMIYYNDMINYIRTNYSEEYRILNMMNLPSSVRQLAWDKIKLGIENRASVYKEATQLQKQMLSIEKPYAWNPEFINIENTIEIIEIFHRNGVDTAEEKSFFLAQVHAETGGGHAVREKLNSYSGEVELSKEFDEYTAVQCVLQNADKYLSAQQLVFFSGNGEDDFESAISQSYIDANGVVHNNTYFTANNLTEERAKELRKYIGENVENIDDIDNKLYNEPFCISDIILYRGGGALQITFKENYYRFAYYLETKYGDIVAAQDIRENGCYSKYITDEYCLGSAEWYYFYGPQKVEEGDTFDVITEKIHGGPDPSRIYIQEVIYNALL